MSITIIEVSTEYVHEEHIFTYSRKSSRYQNISEITLRHEANDELMALIARTTIRHQTIIIQNTKY